MLLTTNARFLQFQQLVECTVRGISAGMCSACGRCGVRWGWRITAGLCHAFLVLP